MDEGIDLIRALWDGETRYQGQHYRYQSGAIDLAAAVRPVQERIPIWVVGVWPGPKSLRRVLRCDGVIPQYKLDGRDAGPADARAVRDWLDGHGARPDLDMVVDGETPADDQVAAAAKSADWAQAGCTWWLETRWADQDDLAAKMRQLRDRVAAGPPRGAADG